MSIFQAAILGLIQGLTEFLPVSSSGHLAVLPQIFGWYEQPLVFDTTMHLATAAALTLYFWKDLKDIIFSFFKSFIKEKLNFAGYEKDAKLGVYLIVAILPAGLLGLFFEDYFENLFRGVLSVAVFLILGSLLMAAAEKYGRIKGELTLTKSLGIGFFQSLALFPGVSRSGSTISGGMFFGLDREQAARFSFLLSIPIVIAAGFFQLVSSPGEVTSGLFLPLVVGFIVSFASGLWAIRFLLNFVKRHSLSVFIIYRFILAGVLLLLAL